MDKDVNEIHKEREDSRITKSKWAFQPNRIMAQRFQRNKKIYEDDTISIDKSTQINKTRRQFKTWKYGVGNKVKSTKDNEYNNNDNNKTSYNTKYRNYQNTNKEILPNIVNTTGLSQEIFNNIDDQNNIFNDKNIDLYKRIEKYLENNSIDDVSKYINEQELIRRTQLDNVESFIKKNYPLFIRISMKTIDIEHTVQNLYRFASELDTLFSNKDIKYTLSQDTNNIFNINNDDINKQLINKKIYNNDIKNTKILNDKEIVIEDITTSKDDIDIIDEKTLIDIINKLLIDINMGTYKEAVERICGHEINIIEKKNIVNEISSSQSYIDKYINMDNNEMLNTFFNINNPMTVSINDKTIENTIWYIEPCDFDILGNAFIKENYNIKIDDNEINTIYDSNTIIRSPSISKSKSIVSQSSQIVTQKNIKKNTVDKLKKLFYTDTNNYSLINQNNHNTIASSVSPVIIDSNTSYIYNKIINNTNKYNYNINVIKENDPIYDIELSKYVILYRIIQQLYIEQYTITTRKNIITSEKLLYIILQWELRNSYNIIDIFLQSIENIFIEDDIYVIEYNTLEIFTNKYINRHISQIYNMYILGQIAFITHYKDSNNKLLIKTKQFLWLYNRVRYIIKDILYIINLEEIHFDIFINYILNIIELNINFPLWLNTIIKYTILKKCIKKQILCIKNKCNTIVNEMRLYIINEKWDTSTTIWEKEIKKERLIDDEEELINKLLSEKIHSTILLKSIWDKCYYIQNKIIIFKKNIPQGNYIYIKTSLYIISKIFIEYSKRLYEIIYNYAQSIEKNYKDKYVEIDYNIEQIYYIQNDITIVVNKLYPLIIALNVKLYRNNINKFIKYKKLQYLYLTKSRDMYISTVAYQSVFGYIKFSGKSYLFNTIPTIDDTIIIDNIINHNDNKQDNNNNLPIYGTMCGPNSILEYSIGQQTQRYSCLQPLPDNPNTINITNIFVKLVEYIKKHLILMIRICGVESACLMAPLLFEKIFIYISDRNILDNIKFSLGGAQTFILDVHFLFSSCQSFISKRPQCGKNAIDALEDIIQRVVRIYCCGLLNCSIKDVDILLNKSIINNDEVTLAIPIDTILKNSIERCKHILSIEMLQKVKDVEMLYRYIVQRISSTFSGYLHTIIKEPTYYKQVMIRVYNSNVDSILYGETPSSLYSNIYKQLYNDDSIPHRSDSHIVNTDTSVE